MTQSETNIWIEYIDRRSRKSDSDATYINRIEFANNYGSGHDWCYLSHLILGQLKNCTVMLSRLSKAYISKPIISINVSKKSTQKIDTLYDTL